MKNLIKYSGLILLLAILGCSKDSENALKETIYDENITTISNQKTIEITERKLIKEGKVEFETKNINTTRKSIFDAANKYKGYISSDQEFKMENRKSNIVVIRIPAEHFDNLLKDATQGVDRFEFKEIEIKDVTEEFLDVEARLKTKKELESRFIELLKQAKSVTDILEIEKQIGQLRSDIESIEGRLKYLQNKVSFSTLTITFYENNLNQTNFGQEFSNSFKNGWENLISFFITLVNLWPFIVLGLATITVYRFYSKRSKK